MSRILGDTQIANQLNTACTLAPAPIEEYEALCSDVFVGAGVVPQNFYLLHLATQPPQRFGGPQFN